MTVPFVGSSYELARKKSDTQRTINMCPTPVESGAGKAKIFLQSIPGLRQFGETPPVPPPPPPPHVCVGGPVWTQRAASASKIWNAIAYGAGRFVAGGGPPGVPGASVMFSTDNGHTWTDALVPPVFAGVGLILPQMMTYGNGVFVCANGGGGDNCSVSSDGSTWSNGINIPSGTVTSVFFDGTNFIAICGAGSPVCCTSPDGVTWTSRAMPQADTWLTGGHGGGVVVALAGSGHTAISTDHGVSWVPGGNTLVGPAIYGSVPYGNGVFVAAQSGVSQRCLYSPDLGATWLLSNVMTLSMILEFSDVGFYQGAFLVLDKTGQSNFSGTDGIDFVAANPLPVSSATSWTYASNGDGKYAAVGSVSVGGTIEASGEC